jgi:hypothetical protein
MEARHIGSLLEAESGLLGAKVGIGCTERISMSSCPDVFTIVVHPHLSCALSKSAT